MSDVPEPKAAAAVAEGADPFAALRDAADAVRSDLDGAPATVATLFASGHYEPAYADLVRAAREDLGADILIGCSAEGVIGPRREVERRPALALAAQSLPGASFRAVHLDTHQIAPEDPAALIGAAGVDPADVRGWLVLADPASIDGEALVARFDAAYPDATLLGGMASGLARSMRVFLNDRVHGHGAVALAVTAPYRLRSIVSQGASPIGEPWTITEAEGNIVKTIGGRPAYEVLVETLRALPPDVLERARSGLLVGLAMDEYRSTFGRGDFLIRNLIGYHPETGALGITASPRVGQTLQFQFRDALAADEDLREQLAGFQDRVGEERPVAAVLCTCNGRGGRMFDTPGHDATAVDQAFPGLPLAGLFCAGEIGSVGDRTFLHGFTASVGIMVREAS